MQWLRQIGVNEQTQDIFREHAVDGTRLLQLAAVNEAACRRSLQTLFFGTKHHTKGHGDNDADGDAKSESQSARSEQWDASQDGLGLSNIEMRNFWANLKHLKRMHDAAMRQQLKVNGGGSKDDYQSMWNNFRNNMNRGTATKQQNATAHKPKKAVKK